MHTIVCGAGYTGRRVLNLLPADAVTSISRPAEDLDDSAVDIPLTPPTFAMLYTVPPSPASEHDLRLARLLSKLTTTPTRIVYLSTSGVYGDRRGGIVNEDDQPSPVTPRAKRRMAAERQLTEWCAVHECKLVILRVPGIYGPGRLGLDRIEAGAPIIRETEASPGNRIHVDDLVACCLRSLEESTVPGIYNVGDGDHRSATEFTKSVARLAELDAPPEVSIAEAEKTFGAARLSFLRESRILDTSKMRKSLGIMPCYVDPADGIRASLDCPQEPAASVETDSKGSCYRD